MCVAGFLSGPFFASADFDYARAAGRLRSRTFEMSFAHSAHFLGTQEIRLGFHVGLEWGRPSRWLTFRGRPDILSQEVAGIQLMRSIHGASGVDVLAVEVGGRWIGAGNALKNAYAEAGTGITIGDGTTIDLDARFNVMSYVGFGGYLTPRPASPRLGIRYVHLSNAGTNRPNYGLNLFQLTYGTRF